MRHTGGFGALLAENGYLIENIDSTIIAQRPRLLPYREQMAENLARALKLEPGQVSVKATTEEGLGFTGSGEGIAAQAVALLSSIADLTFDDRSERSGCAGCPGNKHMTVHHFMKCTLQLLSMLVMNMFHCAKRYRGWFHCICLPSK